MRFCAKIIILLEFNNLKVVLVRIEEFFRVRLPITCRPGQGIFPAPNGQENEDIIKVSDFHKNENQILKVELGGFEPPSKRGINELSTCVVSS